MAKRSPLHRDRVGSLQMSGTSLKTPGTLGEHAERDPCSYVRWGYIKSISYCTPRNIRHTGLFASPLWGLTLFHFLHGVILRISLPDACLVDAAFLFSCLLFLKCYGVRKQMIKMSLTGSWFWRDEEWLYQSFKSLKIIKASLDLSLLSYSETWLLTPMLWQFGENAPGWNEGVWPYGADLTILSQSGGLWPRRD